MNKMYNWSFQINDNLVRIELSSELKKSLEPYIKKFSGILIPPKSEKDTLIVKFESNKIATQFISSFSEKYPNSFHLNNSWDICTSSNYEISFASLSKSPISISTLSNLSNSLFEDVNVISSLTKNEIKDIKININTCTCYFSFNILFSSSEEAKDFLEEFNYFKT